MSSADYEIRRERASDSARVRVLSATAFGPGRFTRTAYRARESVPPVAALSLAAWRDDELIGSVRFTALDIAGRRGALLLGPLTVDPAHAGRGCGRKLVREGLAAAREADFRLVVLVGDLAYYEPAGFVRVPEGQIWFPGPVDAARILGAELDHGALGDYCGLLRGVAEDDA